MAAAQTHSPEAFEALELLCVNYRNPLYAYLRRKGHSAQDAEDLTQEFFAQRVVTKLIFRGMNSAHGRFRTWLLNSFQNFLRNEWDKRQAQKRGGDQPHVSLDLQDAEGRSLIEPAHDETPERIYERAWAMTLLERALTVVREKHERAGDTLWFKELSCFLPGSQSSRPYAEVAAALGKSEEAVKMAVSRLRKEFGKAVKDEIKRTVSRPEEVQPELNYLLAVLAQD